ncbi:thioredoxin domain-containing protein [Aurantiacibacter sp. MUD61]|uniref:thioredoxin domain-containing protein n=1 Tax=Aurantiacibacter sp. MUD61 TaxID=3009083 RepID=UPI0022F118A9|nr:thioredoxin domain-containing protein [Aurantiacibacter sp. MUD61]
MTTSPKRIAYSIFAAPVALALAACGGDADGGVEEGDPIAAIEAPEGQAWTDMVEVSEYGGYVLGNPDAPIKIVEYASLTCPACAAFTQEGAEPLKENYVSTGVVSYEIRNAVLNMFDLTLAGMVRCGPDEVYHPLSDQVWYNLSALQPQIQQGAQALQAAGDLPEGQRFVLVADAAGFYDFFAQRGLSRDQAAACLSDTESVLAIDERWQQQAEEFGVSGTPTFFVNGGRVDGITWADLEEALQRAGARTE